MADDTVDWGQFKPATDSAAAPLDWSQFKPDTTSGGDVSAAGEAPMPEFGGEDRAAREAQALKGAQLPQEQGKTMVGPGEMAERGVVGAGGHLLGVLDDLIANSPAMQGVRLARKLEPQKNLSSLISGKTEDQESDLHPFYNMVKSAKDYAELKKDETTSGEGRIAGGLAKTGVELSAAMAGPGDVDAMAMLGERADRIAEFLGPQGFKALQGVMSSPGLAARQTAINAQELPDDQSAGEKAGAVTKEFLQNLSMAGLPVAFGRTFLPKAVAGFGIGAGTQVLPEALGNTVDALTHPMAVGQSVHAPGDHPIDLPGVFVAGVAGAFMGQGHHPEIHSDPQAAQTVDELRRSNDAQDQKQAELATQVSGIGGISEASLQAGKEGMLASVAAQASSHDDLMQQSGRYRSIYDAAAKSGFPEAQAQQIAKEQYVKEIGDNTAWGSYTKAVTGANAASAKQNWYTEVSTMAGKAMHELPPDQQLILSRWMDLRRPTAIELHQALSESLDGKAAPDYIQEEFGKDFNKDGTFTQDAFLTDQVRLPDAMAAYFPKTPEMAKLFETAGARPYELKDRYALLGDPERVSAIVQAVHESTGILPAMGEQDEIHVSKTAEAGQADLGEGAVREAGTRSEGGNEAPEGSGTEGGAVLEAGQDAGAGSHGTPEEERVLTKRNENVAKALEGVSSEEAKVNYRGEITVHPGTSEEVAAKAIDAAAADTAASNTEFKEPTPAQIESGNYRKGGILLKGETPEQDIRGRIENPDGSVRRGDWGSRPIKGVHYGYIPSTVSADGAPLDAFFTRNAHDPSRKVAVITQHNPKTGKFDELKVVIGAKNRADAMSTYLRQYPANMHKGLLPKGKDNVTMMDRTKFAAFLHSGATDVPPHPISGKPQLQFRAEREAARKAAEVEAIHAGGKAPGDMLPEETKVKTDKDIPLTGGVSKDGKTIYLDPHLPKTVKVARKTIDVHEAVALHERREWTLMHPKGKVDQATLDEIARGMGLESSKDMPLSVVRKIRDGKALKYSDKPMGAHEIATKTENHFIRTKYGVDPEKYQSSLKKAIDLAREQAPHGELPKDLDRKPYVDGGDEHLLEGMNDADKEQPRFIFAGEDSAYGISREGEASVRDAKSMLARGAEPRDIWDKTGWFQGKDGKWRHEISDANAKMSDAFEQANMDVMLGDHNLEMSLDRALNHPELFKQYPFLKRLKVVVDRTMDPDSYGSVQGDTIRVNTKDRFNALSDRSIARGGEANTQLKTILHEVQHAIQAKEGFQQGANPNTFYNVFKAQKEAAFNALKNVVEEQRSVVTDFNEGRIDQEAKNARMEPIQEKLDRIRKYIVDKELNVGPTEMKYKAFDQYQRTAGETEARTTMRRQPLTAEERRQMFPEDSEDVLRQDQILQDMRMRSEHTERSPEDREAFHEKAVEHVERLGKGWIGEDRPLHVLRNMEEISDPELKSWVKRYVPEGMTPGAFYHDGRVYLFSDAHESLDSVERAIAHEMVGHFGLRAFFGKNVDMRNEFLDQVHNSFKDTPLYQEMAKEYRKAYGNKPRAFAEEYVAHLAETGKEPGLWSKIASMLRNFARSMGLKVKWTDNDLRLMLSRIAKGMREGRLTKGDIEPPETVHNDDTGEATSTYVGAGGKGSVVHYYDGSRDIHLPGVDATVESTVLGDKHVMSVSDLMHGKPEDLHNLLRFAAEEGKDAVAIGKDNVKKSELEEAGIKYTEHPGFYEIATPTGVKNQPMFSMRNRASGGQDIDDLVKKTVAHDELNMTPWDRFQHRMREFRDVIQSGDGALWLKTGYIDAGAPIMARERGKFGGLLLDAAQSAYKMFWMSKNNQQITAGVLKVGVPEYRNGSFVPVQGRKGLVDIFKPLFNTHDGKLLDGMWEAYAYAKRANELIDQTNPDGTPKEKLLNRQEIDKLLDLENKYPVFKQVFDEYQKFNQQLLDLAVDRGAMTKETADLWKQNMYVPFYRHMDENQNNGWMFSSKGISGKKVSSKRLFGSQLRVDPVIDNIVRNTGSILDKVYSNEAMRRVVALCEGNGMERVKHKIDSINVSLGDIEKTIAKMGYFVGEKIGPNKYKKFLTKTEMDQLTSFIRMSRPVGNDIVSVMQGGKPVYYRVTDPILYKTITAFDQLGTFDKVFNFVLGGPKKVLTMGVIYNPGFMLRTMFRDAVTAWMQTGTNPNMFKHVMGSVKDVMSDSDFQNGLRVAGFNGNAYFNAHEMREHLEEMHNKNGWTLLSTPKKLWHAYHKIGMLAEQTNRLSVAKHILERGGSVAEAAWQGQNTLNFKMRGANKAMQLLIRVVPFLNARIQGLYRLYNGATGQDVTSNRSKAVMFYAMKAAGVMAASLALQLHNEDDPRYQRLPEVDKDLYYHLFVGNMHFTLPKPFETGAMFSTIPERALRLMSGKDTFRTFTESMKRTVMHTLDFDPTPQAFKPLIEDWANKDALSEHPIVSQHEQRLLPGEQATPYTSPTLTKVAQAMPTVAPDLLRSPERLEHAVRGYTGTVGMWTVQTADAALRASGAFPKAPASKYGNRLIEQIAGPLGVSPADTESRNKYIQQLYDAQDQADKAANTVTDLLKQGHRDEAKRVLADNKTALQYRPFLHAAATQLSAIRKEEMLILQSETMSPQEKRSKMDALNATRTKLLDKAAPLLEIASDYH